MAEQRKKLVKLVHDAIASWEHGEVDERIADHLIDNGVTVHRWIPTSEQLPKEVFTEDGWPRSDVAEVFVVFNGGGFGLETIKEVREHPHWYPYWMPTDWMHMPEPPKEDDC